MTQHWFTPKRYGYGATPANWKGWAATAAFLLFLLGASALLLAAEQSPPSGPSAWQFAVWTLLTTAATLGFVWLARAKTDGQWGWRWGK